MAFFNAMDAIPNRVLGENGAPALTTSSSPLVDLFVKTVRGVSEASLTELCKCARSAAKTPEALADLIVLAFFSRDCRTSNGKGERAIFYSMVTQLAEEGDLLEAVCAVLSLSPHFGSFKDLLALAALKQSKAAVRERCLSLFAEALKADEVELAKADAEKRTPKLSLAGKWAPRENGAYDKLAGLSAALAEALYPGLAKPAARRQYRKLVSKLNAALGTPEVLMASARWSEIQMAKVASQAMIKYRKAFLNESLKGKLRPEEEATGNRYPDDAERVAARANLRAALVSKKGVNGKQLGPHEIASKLMDQGRGRLSMLERDLMDAQWVAMRKGVVDGLQKAVEAREAEVVAAAAPMAAAAAAAAGGGAAGALESVVALKAAIPKSVDLGRLVALVDVSGSMHGQPMQVAIGLGILVSELTSEAFRDRILTFESRPNWVDLSACKSIADKVAAVQSAGWGGSTNFEAACERILLAAQTAKLTADEIPDLLVLSDMQFDMACGYNGYGGYYGGSYGSRSSGGAWETHYERLEKRFAEVGKAVCGAPWAPPRIIFWNLRGNTVGLPVQADAPNTQMLSGFSPALLKLVLTGAELVAVEEEEALVAADGSVKVKRSGPTPEQTLRAALDNEAYDPVRAKLAELTSGPLAAYAFVKEDAGFEIVDCS